MFATTSSAPAQIPDAATLKKMKVTELKDLLTSHGLPVHGKKDELVQRLSDKSETCLKNSFTPGSASSLTASNLPASSAASGTSRAVAAGASGSDANDASNTRTSSVGVGHDEVVVKPSGFVFRKLSFDNINADGTATTASNPPKPGVDAATSQAAIAVLPEDFEKRKQRAARFGLPLADKDKLAERAQRFGASLAQPKPAASMHTPPDSSAAKPAARVNVSDSAPKTTSAKLGIDPEVLKRRQERFGVAPSLAPASSGMALTGTSSVDEEKKRKRAERFGIPLGAEGMSPDKKIKA